MKRVVIVLLAIFFLLAIPISVFVVMKNQELRKKATPATSLSITPTTLAKTVGEEFTLEVKMNTAENQIVAVDLKIIFDATKLEGVWIRNGSMFPNILSSGVVGSGTASIALGAPNTTTPVTGTGTVATLRLKAIAATTTPVTVRFGSDTFVGALNEGSTNALQTSVPATITIGGGTTNPTPTSLTPTLTPTLRATDSASPSAVTISSPAPNASVNNTQPTLRGTAPPQTTVTITIYSDPITVTVTSDANGNWTYTLAQPLASGPHTIVVAARDPVSGQSRTATLAFVVATGNENGATGSAVPVSGAVENTLLLLGIGLLFIITGSIIPAFAKNRL